MALINVGTAPVLSRVGRSKDFLVHVLRMATRPGGLKYVGARSAEVLLRISGFKAEVLFQACNELRLIVRQRIKAKADNTDFLHIGQIGYYIPSPWRGVRLAHVSDPSQSGTLHEFNVDVPCAPRGRESTLVIYATAGFISVWDRIQEDLDRYFTAGWRQVLIVLIASGFRPLSFADHSYILSLLLNNFPRRKYSSHLDVVVSPEQGERSIRSFVSARFWRTFAGNKRSVVHQDQSSPDKFSALVITLEPKAAGAPDTARS
jgi:hypothetical protein